MVTITILGFTAALIFGGALWMWRTLSHERTPVAQAPLGTDAAMEPPASSARPLPAEPAATTDAVPGFTLTGIVEGLGEPYAVINGLIVAEGETVGKATLLDIGEGTVRLRFADGTETVLRVAR